MKIKKLVGACLRKNKQLWWAVSYLRMRKRHLEREVRRGITYYIIRYEDPQSCGWTVWERVVFYSCMYATDHGMIPVVDMQNYKNIYLDENELGRINAWEKFYLQPGGVTLKDALDSKDYIIADPSQEWFCYLRERHPQKYANNEFLRKEFNKYIRIKPSVEYQLKSRLIDMLPNHLETSRMLAICIRGTDYKLFHHMVQPKIAEVIELAKKIYIEYKCDYYFIATEDAEIFGKIQSLLPSERIVTYNAGNINQSSGLIGLEIRKKSSATAAAMDYLTTLYCINRSVCLLGGLCGATIVAKYRREKPYEYINIIDTHRSY